MGAKEFKPVPDTETLRAAALKAGFGIEVSSVGVAYLRPPGQQKASMYFDLATAMRYAFLCEGLEEIMDQESEGATPAPVSAPAPRTAFVPA